MWYDAPPASTMHLESEWELAQAHLTLTLAASSSSAKILLFGWHTWCRSLLQQVYHPNKRIWIQENFFYLKLILKIVKTDFKSLLKIIVVLTKLFQSYFEIKL